MTTPAALLLAALLPLLAGPPRLLRLDATATHTPGGLTGTLTLHVAGWGTLPLEPFGPAVTAARRADGSPLPLVPTAAGLATPVFGDSRLSLDWSARADAPLTLPAAAVRTLTLDLPADLIPTAPAAVSGPYPGAGPNRRRWTIQFGGREPLPLTLRRPPDPAAGPLARADRVMRWEVSPGAARWTAEFTLDVVRGPLPAPTFDVPPGLTVTGRDAANGRLTLTGFAPPPAGPWTPSRVGLAGALPGSDTLVTSHSPELSLAGCDPGGTRLTATDAGRTLTFAGPGTPSLTLTSTGPEFRTAEEQAWRVGPDESVLAVKLTVAVTRGPLDRLTLRLPPGFTPATVRAVPDDPGLTTAVDAGRLTVTPSLPVPGGGKLVLEAEFTATPPLPAGDPADPPPPPLRVVVPTVGVDGAADRSGTVGLAAGPGLHAGTASPAPFHGRPPPLAVTLAADRPRTVVTSDIAVSPVPGGLAVRVTGLADPVDAPVGRLTVFVPAGWRLTADGATVTPVPGSELLLVGGLLTADRWATLLAAGPATALRGRLVRVTPPRPTADPIRLSAVGFVAAGPGRVPLPAVLGADARPPGLRADRSPFDPGPPAGDWPPEVVLRPRGTPAPPVPGGWAFANPTLLARVGPAGRELTFAVTVERAAGPVLPFDLPPGAEMLAASVAGKRADPVAGGLPLPDGAGVPVELRYRLPAAVWRVTAPAPELPADPGPVAVRWAFDPATRRWPTLDAPADPTPGGSAAWAVPATAVRLAGFLLAVVALLAGFGRLPGFAVAVGLLAAAGWVAPAGWREVARPPAAAGLFALAVRPRRAVPPTARRLPSTASYGTAAVSLLLVAAAPPARFDAAEYDLTTGDGGTAAVVARFTLTAAGPTTLPLTGVRLEAVELAGRPALATAVAGGYALDLPAGPHSLTARFAVPLTGRTVRFGVPDVPRCRVTVAGLAGADVASRRGTQRLDGGKIVADHGGGPAVEVQWPTAAPPTAVREACVWDVAEGGSRGVFAVRLAPAGGPAAEAVVTVPAGVEVGPPVVRSDGGPTPTATAHREPGRVRVTFNPPADRPLWLTLPLATAGPALRCPTAGAADGFAAVRGGPFAGVERAGVIDYPLDGLKPFADVPELRLTAAPPARAFQRRPGQEAELTPTLAPLPAEAATAETVWSVGPVGTAAGTVRAERAPAGLVAFDLPPDVTVLDARAGDGSRWTRTGPRVTVWLPAATADPVIVTWTGTRPPGDEVELGGPAGGTVRVEPADGWAVSEPAAGRVRVFPPTPPPATLLEVVERAGDGLAYRATVNLPMAVGRPHRFQVTLGDLPVGVMPTLRGGRAGPAERTGDVVSWAVDADGPVTLALTARVPVGRLPEASVRFDSPPLAWAARGLVVGIGLTADGRPARPADRNAVRAMWPGEADGGTVWAADDDRKVTLAELPKPAPPPVVEPPLPVVTATNWPAAAGWLLAFGLVLTLRPAGPERLAAVGVLGAAAVGGTVGWGFLLLAAAGVLWRLVRFV